ncbi:hypothetical protein F5051DRAFT_412842 [Lentinula edodes]|nr:hypothetical protein F5051DRAFT_412842 [Lentinula edodes]
MYLNPSSPVLPTLRFPMGFNISTTPLITFRRVDLLLSTSELEILHREKHPEAYDDGNFTLFSDEAVWTLSPTTYIEDLFLLPLPYGNYANLIVSTAGHWTTTMFSGYATIDGLIAFFAEAMHVWATHTQLALTLSHDSDSGGQKKNRNVLVRAYLPGHEDCHAHRSPTAQIPPMKWGWYNWGSIPEFNRVFEDILASPSFPTTPSFPNIHFLPIDRPARLRPDAHATGDCLHIIAGAGVLEGWTEYVWHYTTWFLGGGE